MRRGSAPWMNDLYNFNSRTHVECDDLTALESTDAANFNSRTHVECDLA